MSSPLISLHIDGRPCEVPSGISVAAALALQGVTLLRRSPGGQPRAVFCGMGQCQECRVRIDGRAQRLACMTPVAAGMRVETEA